MEIDYGKMGRRVRIRRRELGLTQFALAERCGISTVYVSHVENGTAAPSLGVFLSIAQALETTPDYFLVDTPFASKEYLQDGIAKKLGRCSDASLRVVERLIDALLEEEWGSPDPTRRA